MNNYPKIAIIVLNYKKWRDTIRCLESIQQIDYPNYLTIVIDNGSNNDSIKKIKEWAEGKIEVKSEFVKYKKDLKPIFYIEYDKEIAENGGIIELEERLKKYPSNKKLVIIHTDKNLGFSGGNNVGIRYAMHMQMEGILLLNPDVIVTSPNLIYEMVKIKKNYKDVYCIGPRVRDEYGNEQSPLREPTFLQEVIRLILSPLKKINYVVVVKEMKPLEVEKIIGCCMFFDIRFFKEIGLLDENVFLYGEEAIISSMLKKSGKKILFLPNVSVIHLHSVSSENSHKYFIESRKYYLERYKNYDKWKIYILNFLYCIIFFCVRIKNKIRKYLRFHRMFINWFI